MRTASVLLAAGAVLAATLSALPPREASAQRSPRAERGAQAAVAAEPLAVPLTLVDDRRFADRVLAARSGEGSRGQSEGALDLDPERGSFPPGGGGSVTVAFADNRLLSSGDGRADLLLLGQLGEVGVALRPADTETARFLQRAGRRADRLGFVELGRFVGPNVAVDLDAELGARWYGHLRFDAVRLVDLWDGTAEHPFGPSDVDGVYASTSELLPEDMVGRELSVRVVSAEDLYKPDDAVGRELSVQVVSADDDYIALDVVGRELSVRVTSAADDFLPSDVVGRELSVRVVSSEDGYFAEDVVGRELSVQVFLPGDDFVPLDVISRELSVQVFLPGDDFVPLDVISRELSIHIPSANLIAEQVDFSPGLVEGGDTLTVTWRVRNGGLNTATGPWFDRLWLSQDGILDPQADVALTASTGTTLFAVPGPLAPGAEVLNTQQVVAPDLPGLFFVLAQTNATGAVNEDGLLGDNVVAAAAPLNIATILLPDLVPGASLTGVPTAAVLSGTGLTVGFGVQNSGPGSTVGGWTDQLYLAVGQSLSGATLLASQGSVFGLPAGGSYPNQFQVNLPANIQGTGFYLALVVDGPVGAGKVGEQNEGNNLAFAGPFDIALQPQPDLVAQFVTSPQVNITEGAILPNAFAWQLGNIGAGPTNTGEWQERLYFSKTADPAIGPDDVLLATFFRSGPPLGPGGSESHSLASVVVPPGTVPPGETQVSGYFKLRVDSSNVVVELDLPPFGKANNVAVSIQVPLSKAALPNLAAQSVAPAGPAIAGFALPIQIAVSPTGGVTQGAYTLSWADRVFLEATVGGASFQLGNFDQSNQPNAQGVWQGVPYAKTVSPVVPAPVPTGEYRLRLVVDASNAVTEVSETDNEVLSSPFQVVFEPVDLAISLPGAPPSGAVKQSIPLSWTVTNLGPGKTIQTSWVDQVHLSLDGVTPLGAAVVSVTRSGALAVGQTYTVSTSGSLPIQPPGDYQLLFRTDVNGVVPELALFNNNAAQALTLSPEAADLVVTGVLADRNLAEGQPLLVSWTVENQGSFQTTSNNWSDRIWLSSEPTLNPGALVLGDLQHSGALAVGANYLASRSVTIPFGTIGVRYLIVETDLQGQVFESNDQNNTSSRQFLTVGATGLADLTVTQVAPQVASVTAGQPLDVRWTVANVGAGATNAPDWVDRVYLSLDAVLNLGIDPQIGFHVHQGFLGNDQDVEVVRTYNVPANLAGNYFVIVRTNAQAEVLESGSATNVAFGTQPVAVGLPLPADLVVEEVEALGTWAVNASAQIRYRVRNIGQNTVQGQWRDAVFLTKTSDVDGAATLLAQYTVTPPGPLAPGESVLVERDLGKLPGVLPQNYRAAVRADILNQIPEPAGLDVNLGASPPVAVDMAALGLGAGGAIEFDLASGQSAWFQMTPPAGTTVRWTATHDESTAWISLYGSEGQIPTPGTAQVSGLIPVSPLQAVLIEGSAAPANTWYGLVRASTGAPAGTRVRLVAEVVPLELAGLQPALAGAGVVTLRLAGEKLAAVATPLDVRLSFGAGPGGSPSFVANAILFDTTSGDLLARFDLSAAPLGTYTVQVQTPGASEVAVLPAGLGVEAPTAPTVVVQVVPPVGVKKGSVGFATARIQNAGNVNLERGLLTLVLDAAQGSAAEGGLDWVALGVSAGDPAHQGAIDSLVLFAPTLAPGASAEAVLSLSVPANFPDNLATFGLSGRPLSGPQWYLSEAPAQLSVLGRVAEELRQAVLASPQSPADLLALASNTFEWNLTATGAFMPYLGSALSVAPKAQPLGVLLDALVAAVSTTLGSGAAPAASAVDEVRGQLACLVFADTALLCQDLVPPAVCNAGVSGAPLLISAGSNIPIAAVCWPTPTSQDPNEKRNNPGFGQQQQVAAQAPVDYRIEFENIASAQASASFVEILDPLQAGLDPASFELRTIRFGETVIEVPPGNSFYFGAVDLTESLGVIVQISAGLVFFDGQIEDRFAANGLGRPEGFEGSGAAVLWNLLAIDPATGLPPTSGLEGILPPNSPDQDGTGHVEFATGITPGQSSGSPISNRAKIQFDVEPPLTTNAVTNTVDKLGPESQLTGAFVGQSNGAEGAAAGVVELTWSAEDDFGGSGVLDHTLYVSVDHGPFEAFLVNTEATVASFPVEFGRSYAFHVRSRDNTGQVEPTPTSPGFEIFVGTDCNGNGVDDALDVASGTSFDCNFNGIPDECELDSNGDGILNACAPLTADIASVSVSAGGVQQLSLQAGLSNANRAFLFVGSLSGSQPGVVVDGLKLPLNPDAYTAFLFAAPSASLLQPMFGQLDEQGRAKAQVTVPPGLLPSAPGLHLSHTYLVFDIGPVFAPRPVTLRLLP